MSERTDTESLTQAYGVFQQEAVALDTDYAPQTVTTDGWEAPRTTNMADRLMNYQDQMLEDGQLFHGIRTSANLAARAMALLWTSTPMEAGLALNPRAAYHPFLSP